MQADLIEKLFIQYPKIFTTKNSIIDCGDGWYEIINSLCNKIQNYIDKEEETQTRIFKIRNLYGEMFIEAYTDSVEAIEKFIEEAEQLSTKTCEFTGKSGRMHCLGSLYHVMSAGYAKQTSFTPHFKHKIPGLG